METFKLAAIIRNSTNNDEFLIVKQNPPSKYDDKEYDSYADSDLWDLPSAKLVSLSPEVDSSTQIVLQGEEACSHKLNLIFLQLLPWCKIRRNRESSILKSIEAGSKNLFDIISYTYADVDWSLWIHAASNVRLHIDHLALHNKLPKSMSARRRGRVDQEYESYVDSDLWDFPSAKLTSLSPEVDSSTQFVLEAKKRVRITSI
ncbi:hypothetical protein L1887_30778 [Cichorium endivia]|nr:hypothetical protein L1887_30778 [Cichorium endivia]